LFFNFSVPTERILKIIFDSGKKIYNLDIMKGPIFRFVWFFVLGDFTGKSHLVAWEEIGKRPCEKFEFRTDSA
jgi:hypothetical protein